MQTCAVVNRIEKSVKSLKSEPDEAMVKCAVHKKNKSANVSLPVCGNVTLFWIEYIRFIMLILR